MKTKSSKTNQGRWLPGFLHLMRKMNKTMKTKRIVSATKKKKKKIEIESFKGNQISSSSSSSHSAVPGFSCKSTIKSTTIHLLPEEVLAVILKRLPLKYLLRCRSVQKSWYFLVQSPHFKTIHLNHQKMMINTHHHPKYLLFRNEFSNEIYCFPKYPTDLPRSVWLSQSYGLICVTSMFSCRLGYKPDIHLWNPLIQKYKTLPESPLSSFTNTRWSALAFGFVPQVNDYVVVHIVKPRSLSAPHPHSVMIGVYSLNTNSWKITSQDNVFVCGTRDHHHVLIDGVAYWLGEKPSTSRQILLCFDTKTDILREISLPDWVENEVYYSSLVIHPFRQSIAYIVENRNLNHSDMWVLKGNPIHEFSWEKKISARLHEDFRPDVLGVRNNGEPILFKLFNFISYNLDSHKANDFVVSWDRWDRWSFYGKDYAPPYSISPFVESLTLLN